MNPVKVAWQAMILSFIMAQGVTSAIGATQEVLIQGFAFVPSTLTINVGDTVNWTQKDAIQHTSTSDASPPDWNSGLLTLNQSYSFTFNAAGTFPYHCIPHALTMHGSVTVRAASVGPVVQMTEPADGMAFAVPANVTLTAMASNADNTISVVEFFDGTNSLGASTITPYTLTVTNMAAGTHVLTAKATDLQGASTVSEPVTIQVNDLPVVQFKSPGVGAVYLPPANITLQVTATETNGTIDHVEFFVGTSSIGVVNQSPYILTWSNVSAGNYSLTSKAVDARGDSTMSAPRSVVVTEVSAYNQHNLVSDLPGMADHTDTNLVNPWGIATSSSSPFWISDNHSGLSTLYDTTGTPLSLVVGVPPANGGNPPGSPTGILFNGSASFMVEAQPARFIFATEDGTISAWNTGTSAELKADNSTFGTVYKGLAIANNGSADFLYAADFHNGNVDIFDGNFNPINLSGAFTDPALPSGYAPFGIQQVAGNIYVTYALQDAEGHDDVPGAGHGYVDVFDTSGNFLRRLISNGSLNSPWGVTMAPEGFGIFSGALLVGNFGDGRINAFDPATGAHLGALPDLNGNPIAIQGLWGLMFGNGGRGGDANRLYFAAGIAGEGVVEDHGLFGSISATPAVMITSVVDNGTAVTMSWTGGSGPYLLQRKDAVTDTNWFNVLTTHSLHVTVPKEGPTGFYRVMDNATNIVIPLSVLLSGPTEVPAVATEAVGEGSLSVEGMQLTYHISYSGLSGDATAAHIHGPADTTQPASVLIPLEGASGTSGVLSGTHTLTSNEMAILFSGLAYVNIHTPANQGGEIRGQIVPLRIPITMSGAAEVSPVSTPGVASGWITLIGNQMFYDIPFVNLSADASAAHIHGPADVTTNAPVLIPFTGASGTSGTLSGQAPLTPLELNYLLEGLTYINIHTSLHPGGEIRGQVLPWQFTVALDGESEVPSVVSSGTGSGTLSLSGTNLTYSIRYSGLSSDAQESHIHGPADAGHPAGVLFPLAGAAGTSGTLSGSESLTADWLADIVAGMTYVNIHTTLNGGGEIRGQVLLKY